MNLADYVQILVRRGWIILLAVALTAGSAYVFSKRLTPVYLSTQKILIEPARPDLGLGEATKQLLSSFVARMDTNDRATEAIDVLKLDMTPAQLHSAVTVSSDLNTLLITVDVKLTDGDLANRVAQTYGTQFVQWRNQENAPLLLQDRINAEILDAPIYHQFSPNTSVNVAAGGLLGLLLGGVIVFAMEFAEANILRSSGDVERFLQLQVLGNLPPAE
jgi:capsular polysaccharide biosynthesis protein